MQIRKIFLCCQQIVVSWHVVLKQVMASVNFFHKVFLVQKYCEDTHFCCYPKKTIESLWPWRLHQKMLVVTFNKKALSHYQLDLSRIISLKMTLLPTILFSEICLLFNIKNEKHIFPFFSKNFTLLLDFRLFFCNYIQFRADSYVHLPLYGLNEYFSDKNFGA